METPAQPKTEAIRPTESRNVWRVPSDTHPGRGYRVDIAANSGAGFCPCTDFGTRRQKEIDAGCLPWTKETTCKHLDRLMRYLMREIGRTAAASERDPNESKAQN